MHDVPDHARPEKRTPTASVAAVALRDPHGGCLPGVVYLVGAGPGAPDLITLRGHRLLASADVVVHDALVEPALYVDLPAEKVDVGKRAGVHALPQDEICALLARMAQQGRRVVRLKGGDPFVLGRGSEEALFLAERGVPHLVVPGISSAIAGPLLAGIPVTHRGVADAFCVVSAHPREGVRDFNVPPYREQLTVVLLMGVRSLGAWIPALRSAGWPGETPLAFVEWAGRPQQRALRTTLAEAENTAAEAALAAPAVAVVGGVAALAAGDSEPPYFGQGPSFQV